VKALNDRHPLHFFAFENVTCLQRGRHKATFDEFVSELTEAGFNVKHYDLNAVEYGVPQKRNRLIAVGLNRSIYGDLFWDRPAITTEKHLTVKDAIGGLPEPVHYSKGLDAKKFPKHANHWCMAPKSPRFKNAGLRPGDSRKRSFKTLSWDSPSLTVAYGHREVHVHPSCARRLSVYEAMLLQGFPPTYELLGSLSSQIDQVSEAVPPPLAKAVANSIIQQLGERLLTDLADRVSEEAA
jgi:DNA (cytosine-5)-methyltransferase 1